MAHSKLYRSFIILQEDERGHSVSNDKPLSGYAKIEAKSERCKIAFYAQNLKKDYDKCYMILICSKKETKKLLNLGLMNINQQGKAEASIEYDAMNVAETGIEYDKIVGAAICKEVSGKMIYLMYGFLNGEQPKDEWKNYEMIHCKEEKKSMKKEEKKEEKKDVKKKTEKKMSDKDMKKNDNKKKSKECEVEYDDNEYCNNQIERESNDECISKPEEIREVSSLELEDKFDDYEKEIAGINSETSETESDDIIWRCGMGEFFENIVAGFEPVKGFCNEIKNCKWYKVPVGSFDEMCNISNYNKYTVAYYPMINYYPYIAKKDYFMIGLKCDKEGKVKYVVYGVPGSKERCDQPYNGKTGFVTWVKDEKESNSGHWIMFYDHENCMVVVPMK